MVLELDAFGKKHGCVYRSVGCGEEPKCWFEDGLDFFLSFFSFLVMMEVCCSE
jgi:hypothetical protein